MALETNSNSNSDNSKPVSVTKVTSKEDFTSIQSSLPPTALSVLYFHAPWAAPCQQMSAALDALASTYTTTCPPSLSFTSVDAEEQPDIAETYDVPAVPFVILQRDGKTLESVSGSDPARVRAALEKHYSSPATTTSANGAAQQAKRVDLPPAQIVTRPAMPATGADLPAADAQKGADQEDGMTAEDEKERLRTRLSELVKAAPVMLFMKGTPSAPQCGFSRQTVGILREKGVRYGFFNILADDDVRQGLKEYADWPTYPQVWVDGELVGGLDIVSSCSVLIITIVIIVHIHYYYCCQYLQCSVEMAC